MQVHGRFNQSNHQLYNHTMARYNKGISGSFSGKVGTVIGNFYKKKTIYAKLTSAKYQATQLCPTGTAGKVCNNNGI
jgi:hypothetical protein